MSEETRVISGKIKEILEKMNLKFFVGKEEKEFVVPFLIETSEGKVRANVLVRIVGDWILTVAPIIDIDSILNRDDRLRLYERLLLDNYYLKEVTYGLSEEGTIVVHAETHKNALTFENFKGEFFSVVFGVQHFVEKLIPEFKEYAEKSRLEYVF